MAQNDMMEQEGQADQKASSTYDAIAQTILDSPAGKPSSEDCDAVCAALVAKLRVLRNLPPGSSEEGLYSEARQMYWQFKDAERKKKYKDSGEAELCCDSPNEICD